MRTLIGSGIQAKTKLAYDHYRPRALRLTLHIPVLPSTLGAGLRVSATEACLRKVGGAVRVLKRHARGAAGAARGLAFRSAF